MSGPPVGLVMVGAVGNLAAALTFYQQGHPVSLLFACGLGINIQAIVTRRIARKS